MFDEQLQRALTDAVVADVDKNFDIKKVSVLVEDDCLDEEEYLGSNISMVPGGLRSEIL